MEGQRIRYLNVGEKMMQTQRILLTTFMLSFMAMLYGCQPKESTQDNKALAHSAPDAQQTSTDHAAAPVVSKAEFTKLAQDIGCFACHSIEKKLLGPAWKDVAAIYRQDPVAEDKIMNKIAKGGDGVWGKIAMPAYPDLSEANRRTLTKYILSLK